VIRRDPDIHDLNKYMGMIEEWRQCQASLWLLMELFEKVIDEKKEGWQEQILHVSKKKDEAKGKMIEMERLLNDGAV